jgi:hypothetical protein
MSLRMYYDYATLAGADPHNLAIFAWNASDKRWNNLGGRLFYEQHFLTLATRCFTTYALVATPSWRDEFDGFDGLDFPGPTQGVALGGTLENRTLVLRDTVTQGVAVSKPITPTGGFVHWDHLTFTRTVDPPTTTLTVDVLAPDGTPILTDVPSGIDLSQLDAEGYPALKLRANLSSTVLGASPALDRWLLTWQVEEHKVYVPLVLK